MQQHLVVEYKTCTSYMQLRLPNAFLPKLLVTLPVEKLASKFMFIANPTKCGYKTSSNFTGGKTCFKIYVFGIIQQLRDY